jgi:hemerythrin-like domain-containing protein
MKPIGPLMREHRLIERMVGLIETEQRRLLDGGRLNHGFVEAAVDFFRVYADRTHHGKEEDILFKQLAAKNMSPELTRIMKELIAEHAQARALVGKLADAAAACRRGDAPALKTVTGAMAGIAALYPEHIKKEDKRFFFPILEYLGKAEQDAMLGAFWEFDRSMIHEKYQKMVAGLED